MNEKQSILDFLSQTDFDLRPVCFDDVAVDIAHQRLHLNLIDAQRRAENKVRAWWNFVIQSVDDDFSKGRQPLIEIIDRERRQFRPYWSTVDETDPDSIILSNKLKSRPYLFQQISLLDDRQYEALGSVTCKLLGASKTHLTVPKGDGGIDFFAVLRMRGTSHVLHSPLSALRIVGQSKKYTTPVNLEKVDSFRAVLNDIRCRSERAVRVLPTWFSQYRGPIAGWMMGHRGFQSGAIAKARAEGLLLSDSRDLAEIIAYSSKLHPLEDYKLRGNSLLEMIRKELVPVTT